MKDPVYPGAVIHEDCLKNLGLIFPLRGLGLLGGEGHFESEGFHDFRYGREGGVALFG